MNDRADEEEEKQSKQHPTPPMQMIKRPIVRPEDGAIFKADEVGEVIERNR